MGIPNYTLSIDSFYNYFFHHSYDLEKVLQEVSNVMPAFQDSVIPFSITE